MRGKIQQILCKSEKQKKNAQGEGYREWGFQEALQGEILNDEHALGQHMFFGFMETKEHLSSLATLW